MRFPHRVETKRGPVTFRQVGYPIVGYSADDIVSMYRDDEMDVVDIVSATGIDRGTIARVLRSRGWDE